VSDKNHGEYYNIYRAKPAHIHAFVYPCDSAEVKEFSRSFDFLNILVNNRLEIPTEDLTAAALREMSKEQTDPRAFLVGGGKALTSILSGDTAAKSNSGEAETMMETRREQNLGIVVAVR